MLSSNTIGNGNTACGFHTLSDNDTGVNNTAVGRLALCSNITGSGNIAVGNVAGTGVTTANSVICIGSVGVNASNSCFIDHIFGEMASGGVGVFVTSNGKLGTNPSSRQFKDEIKPMKKASEALFLLKPVTSHYKKELDPAGLEQFASSPRTWRR